MASPASPNSLNQTPPIHRRLTEFSNLLKKVQRFIPPLALEYTIEEAAMTPISFGDLIAQTQDSEGYPITDPEISLILNTPNVRKLAELLRQALQEELDKLRYSSVG